MLVEKAYIFRLRPTEAQKGRFADCARMARYAWNWTLGFCEREYEAAVQEAQERDDFRWVEDKDRFGKTRREPDGNPIMRKVWNAKSGNVNEGRLYKIFCQHRDSEATWIKDFHSHVYSYPIKRVVQAYRNWWSHKAKGSSHFRKPRFKNRKKPKDKKLRKRIRTQFRNSFTIQFIHRRNLNINKINIPGVGWIKTNKRGFIDDPKVPQTPRDIIGSPLSITVSERAYNWYVSITCREEIPNPAPRPNKRVIGIDTGVNFLATLSNEELVEPPEHLEKALRKLKRLQRHIRLQQVGSNGFKRQKVKIAKLHDHVRRARLDFLHKLTRKFVREFDVIVFEKYNIQKLVQYAVPKNMKGKRKAKRRRLILGAAWGEMRRQLMYKGLWYGAEVLFTDKLDPTDQTCHICGELNKMPPTTSSYVCEQCGLETTRQLNTAKLLENYGRGEGPLPVFGKEPDPSKPKKKKARKKGSSSPRKPRASSNRAKPLKKSKNEGFEKPSQQQVSP